MRKPATSSISRRKALAVGVGAVAAGAVAAPIFGLATKPAAAKTDLLSWWPQQGANLAVAGGNEWAAHVGKSFILQTERGKVGARLIEVQALPSRGDRPREVSRESAFALIFSPSAGAAPAGDRIYKLTHESGREMAVYFSATARNMLAVFN